MNTTTSTGLHRSIFSPANASERAANFESYWLFTQKHSGDLLESEKDLTNKRDKLRSFKDRPVTLAQPFASEAFYRNYVHLVDAPQSLDRKTLLLTCIYKFARHEWVGITGAWDAIPDLASSKNVTDRISRYHLAEEFCHIRLFHEMFLTLGLDQVKWVPLSPFMERIYRIFPLFPETLMSPLAFITELMGIVFYRQVDAILDDIFADEPAARDRIRALLDEITVDELAHIGQRRNYIGAFGMQVSKWILAPMFKMFFADIPETRHLFNMDEMIKQGQSFDYNEIPPKMLERTWIPSYCL